MLDYLGRYVQKTAIANSRILGVGDGEVAFRYHDNRDEGKEKVMRLSAEAFITRFLQHVLESGFVRVRYFGLFANCWRKKIAQVRSVLGAVGEGVKRVYTSVVEMLKDVAGIDIGLCCPKCGIGWLLRLGEMPELEIKFHSSG